MNKCYGVCWLYVALLAILTCYRATYFGIRGEFSDLNGTRVPYIKQGSGPVLLRIHGARGHLKNFTFDLVSRFAKDFTVIAIDRLAHGSTPGNLSKLFHKQTWFFT